MKFATLIAFFTLIQCGNASAQDVSFARRTIDTLTSRHFWGRGYTKDGMHKAAEYLAERFKEYHLAPVSGHSYYQHFSYPANIFPGRMGLWINDKKLTPGKDFIVRPESKGVHARGVLEATDSTHYVNRNYRVIVSLEGKLTWSVAPEEADYTSVEVDKKAIDAIPTSFQADIENKLVESFKAANVCGWIKGTAKPDSIITITAHYDHLGGMGADTYFPGANDNASGVSLLLGLAKYYAAHPQPYTIAFIAFAGEEAGLQGSKYFTEHPPFPLRSIRFLINLDLEGNGEEGITVMNATEYPKEFAMLNEVNNSTKLLVKINARGKGANSDHYWFSEKGVPAFFFYTLGGVKAYHDVFDIAATLPLTEYEDLLKLVVKFNERLMQ